MSQTASSPGFEDEVAAQRRARLHARMATMGKRPLTGAEILALQAADDDGFPDEEELDAFLGEIYAARDHDLARRRGNA
jgi:hypothetical protein